MASGRNLRSQLAALDPLVGDSLLALLLAVIGLAGLATESPPGAMWRAPDAVAFGLGVLLTLPIALRRRYPAAVLAVVLTAAVVYRALVFPPLTIAVFGVLIAFYTIVVHGDRWERCVGLTAMGVFLVLLLLTEPPATRSLVGDVLSHGFILGVTFVLAHNVRLRREQAVELERRAQQLEAAHEELAQQAVAEERLRIARELHDVVAHSVSVIAVQSTVGRHVLATQPHEAAKALGSIETVSRSALHELRRLLGVLRDEGQPRGSLTPTPSLADLDALVSQMADVGLQVHLEVEGPAGNVPTGVDLSAYRIVQEALTNVIKHAGRCTARVRIRYGEDEIAVEVTNDRPGSRGSANGSQGLTGGNGIVGMRERVAAFGGDFSAGPSAGGGFRVAARLPFGEPPR